MEPDAIDFTKTAALGDPSTEDVTARVLHGLGCTGLSVQAPVVQRAIEFLKRMQCKSGAFWGRWVLNYLSCTAFVLMGLKSVRADPGEEWVRRAVRCHRGHGRLELGGGGWGASNTAGPGGVRPRSP